MPSWSWRGACASSMRCARPTSACPSRSPRSVPLLGLPSPGPLCAHSTCACADRCSPGPSLLPRLQRLSSIQRTRALTRGARAQLEALTPPVLVARLVAGQRHLLALRVAATLGLSADFVLVHWACAKISAAGDTPDERLRDTLVARLAPCAGVRYAAIAEHAQAAGRRGLAALLLEHEPCAAEQARRTPPVHPGRRQLALAWACMAAERWRSAACPTPRSELHPAVRGRCRCCWAWATRSARWARHWRAATPTWRTWRCSACTARCPWSASWLRWPRAPPRARCSLPTPPARRACLCHLPGMACAVAPGRRKPSGQGLPSGLLRLSSAGPRAGAGAAGAGADGDRHV